MFVMGFLGFACLEKLKSLIFVDFIMLLKKKIGPLGEFHIMLFGHWSHVHQQVNKRKISQSHC